MVHWRKLWKNLTLRRTEPTRIIIVDKKHVLQSIGIPHPDHAVDDLQKNVTLFLYDTTHGADIKHVSYIKVIVHSFNGVAYTTSKGNGKEIHVNANHIKNGGSLEALGILAHELTHVWQNDGSGSLPSYLVEGIADLVRLELGYVPPHWSTHVSTSTKWNDGYHVTAYFLKFLNTRFPGSVKALNRQLVNARWDERWFSAYTGYDIDTLWNMYIGG